MAGINISAYSAVLKTVYLPPIQEALNQATVLLSKIGKESRDLSGNEWKFPVHYGRNYAAGLGVADGGYTPTPGQQSYVQASAAPKFIYGTVRFTGPVIAATKNDQGAFVRAIKSEIDGLMKDVKKSVNRQLHGDSRDALAFAAAAANNTTALTLDDGNGYVFTHLTAGVAIPVSILDGSTGTYAANEDKITITLGAEGSTTFAAVASEAVTVADGDLIVPATGTNTNDANTFGKQMMGIEGIIADDDPTAVAAGSALTSLQGLAVATYPWWKAQVVGSDSSHADLSFANMQKVLSKIAQNSDFSETDVKFILCSYQVRDKYVQLCIDERRFFNTMELDGGFKAVDFNGLPIVPDSQCKRGRMYFIVPSSMKILRTSDFEWMDKDGSYLSRVSGVDAYDATLVHYGNLVVFNRNANGILVGINE